MPKQIRRAAANFMFSKDDIIFSYTTNQAVEDGVLVKTDSKLSNEAAIQSPVYFTSTVWNKYIKVTEKFKDSQDLKARLWDIFLCSRSGQKAVPVQSLLFGSIAVLRKSTLPNLFDDHLPFQIDGNFGGTAGIAEMLLQSHGGEIFLLPSLPQEWANGSVKGLRAREGFEVDIKWEVGRLQTAKIKSLSGTPLEISYQGKTSEFTLNAGEEITLNGDFEK